MKNQFLEQYFGVKSSSDYEPTPFYAVSNKIDKELAERIFETFGCKAEVYVKPEPEERLLGKNWVKTG